MSSSRTYAPFWPLVSAVLFGSFLATLCTTGLNVALPDLMRSFDAPLQSVQWTLTITLLAVGTVAPLAGYLGDRFGLKRLYIWALGLFTVVSALCALAPSLMVLILLRAVQGAACGLIIPTTMTLIYQSLPREQHAMGIAIWSTGSALAPAIAPTLSGWLLTQWGLPSVFLMNLPVGLLGMVVASSFIPAREGRPSRLDLPGFGGALIAGIALLVGFTEGPAWGWLSARTIGLLVLGVVVLALFVWQERRSPHPVLDVRVFGYLQYRIAVAINAVLNFCIYGGMILSPIYLQQVRGLSSFATGLWMMPAAFCLVLFTPLAGRLYSKLGPRPLVLLGLALLAAGNAGLGTLTQTTNLYLFLAWMSLRYIGIAFISMPVTNTGMSAIPRHLTGHGSAMNNWIRQGSASLSVGLFAALVGSRTVLHMQAGGGKAAALTTTTNELYWWVAGGTVLVMLGALALRPTPKAATGQEAVA